MGIYKNSRPYGNIILDGLVINLDAVNPSSYPGSGATWFDTSGKGNNATLIASPVYTVQGAQTNFAFNGSSTYATTTYIPPASSYSMGVWAKSSTSGVNNRVMGNGNATDGLSGTGIIWGYPSVTQIDVTRRNGFNNSTRDTAVTVSNLLTTIHNIYVTYESTSIGTKVFVDGIQVGQNATLGFTSTLAFNIARDGSTAATFNGTIYNLQMYNRALSDQEVIQNYNALKSRFV